MIYVVRHGETEANVEGRLQGLLDTPLTHLGRRQASAIGDLLAGMLEGERPRLVSSPIGRALTTARIVADRLGCGGRLETDERLVELDFAHWSGLRFPEIEERYPGEQRKRNRDKWTYRGHGGENYRDVASRAESFLESLDNEAPVVVVTHEVLSRLLRGLYAAASREATLKTSHRQDRVYRLEAGLVAELVVDTGSLRAIHPDTR